MSKKHMARVENNTTKSDWIFRAIAIMIAIFMIGWGENYIARKKAEAHLEEVAQHERLADEFNRMMAGYRIATIRNDPSYQYEVRVAEDGDGLYLDEWGSTWGRWNQHYSWYQLVEKQEQLRLEIEAQTYKL